MQSFRARLTPFIVLLLLAQQLPARTPGVPEFRQALPGYKFQFPRDHASHARYRTEWWYYTGHLQGQAGRSFGYQLTFFRMALLPALQNRKSKWATRDVILAHLALTDETNGKFYFCDRAGRAVLNLAGAETIAQSATPAIWLDDWRMSFSGRKGEFQSMWARGKSVSTSTDEEEFGLRLTQALLKPPAVHGIDGVSQKSPGRGQASHYYSMTRLATRGTVSIGGENFAVTGESWFDHEFGTNQMAENQVGWDWFSLQLNDGRELMLYRMRLRDGGTDPYSSGTIVDRDGTTRHLKVGDFNLESLATWKSAESGANYPARWRISVPSEAIELEVEPTVANQELNTKRSTQITYWEGSIRAKGTQRGQAVEAKGYVELTGYAEALGGVF